MNNEEAEEVWRRNVDPKSLDNEEQFEAHQQAIDDARNTQIADLSVEDKNKFAVVDRVVKELADAGILCTLFPRLPDPRYKCGTSVLQYNTSSILRKQPKKVERWKVVEYMLQFYGAFAYWMKHSIVEHYKTNPWELAITTNIFQKLCQKAHLYCDPQESLTEQDQKIKDLADHENH